jgi:choline monooxygenase
MAFERRNKRDSEDSMPGVDGLLGKISKLAALPLSECTPLPPELYHSQELYELERSRLFAAGWVCPGMAAEIPKPGDYISFSVGDQPFFVIRGRDGAVHSYSNVCLHRMMILLEGRGSCSRIVCPYHAWTYDIDGQLVGAPHMKRTPGFETKQYRLPELRTEIWEGWIYVTLDPKIQSVAALLAPLQTVVADYAMAGYVPVVTQDHVWKTNWKLLNENFMEGYHLPVAHRKTVGAWYPMDDTSFPDEKFEPFTYQTFTKSEGAKFGRAHSANTRLKDPWRFTSVMPTVFPAHMYVLAPDHLWYLSLRPKALGEVHVRFGAALAPEVMESLNDPQTFVGEMVDFFDRVNEEDRVVVEGLYRGTGAPLARPGRLSWVEEAIHDFIRYLDRNLARPVQSPTG